MRSIFAKQLMWLLSILAGVQLAGQAQSAKAARDSIEVRVVADIVVDKEGNISSVAITHNSCPNCSKTLKKSIEKEAARLIKEGPKMEPRRDKKGNAQTTYYRQPIVFKIAAEE
jgi:hypothetical protein